MKTLVIIPTLNCQKKIIQIVEEIEEKVKNIDILVIDHGSEDRTIKLLKNNNINHLVLPIKSSYYSAMELGMKFAKENGYELLIEWDDKAKFNTDDMNTAIEMYKKESVDIVLGSRFVGTKLPKKIRWFGTRVLKFAFRHFAKSRISDPTLRFRVYGKNIIDYFAENELESLTPNIIGKLLRDGMKFSEFKTKINSKNNKQMHNGTLTNIADISKWFVWMMFYLPFTKKEKR